LGFLVVHDPTSILLCRYAPQTHWGIVPSAVYNRYFRALRIDNADSLTDLIRGDSTASSSSSWW
ncbi:hypothetical protein COCC4DRAFT_31336, partial [Bipolaris maydis ATCC 48331]